MTHMSSKFRNHEFTRFEELLIGACIGMVLALIAGIGLFIVLRLDSTDVPPTAGIVDLDTAVQSNANASANGLAQAPPQSAHISFVAAQREAVLWHEDAQLLNATATWASGTTLENFMPNNAVWAYAFYSPSSDRVALISVTEETQIYPDQPANEAVHPIAPGAWQMDSVELVELLMNNGGKQFLQSNGRSALTLSLGKNQNRIEWLADLISDETGAFLSIVTDANSGEILLLEEMQ